ncbi:MotA/TolQ/ExbB proton channel family protein [Sulfurospirillum oryzae]|uniref:MotA/TolQ/ExbB proton channel family protein n=1 Tax=Sulfurospirillum oryzae TaxID=2976535 RepID=UPI0021E7F855|nr:MotA/TolQ/ExbB proton channel family protein [Sulfurospirillum oryzae]
MQENMSETLQNLAALEAPKRNCAMVYLKLILLPTLAYLYFLLGFLGILHFKVGIHSIVLIGFIYIVALIFAKHNGEFGACTFRRYSKEFQTELHEYVTKNLMPIGETLKSNASFQNFIDTYAKRIRNDNYASVAASIFPTMGILGTFISIAITLPDFSSQNAGALENEISLLLSGVGTAFYVSIYGILLSLWWIFFEKRGLSRFDREVALIEESTASLFWTKEEIEHAYVQENLQHFERIGKMFEHLSSSDFFERLGKNIEAKFELFDEMLTLEAAAVKRGAEHIKEGMDALSRSQEKQRDLVHLHEEMLTKLNSFNEKTTALHVKMLESNEEMITTNQEVLRALKETSTARSFPAQNEEVESLKESLKMIDAETEEIILKMDALK